MTVVPDGTRAHCKSAPTVKKHCTTRPDAPAVRNVRRGSASNAISSLHTEGEPALVEELMQDRNANSSQAPIASMVSTWHRFHHEAFDTPAAVSPVLPVTIRSLVVVGALFKKGGYRSFDNYVSAIKGQHIEAGLRLDTAPRTHGQVGVAQCHPRHWTCQAELQLRL